MLDYDFDTGELLWVEPAAFNIKPGTRAGTIDHSNGKRRITINNHRYMEAAVIWLWVTGEWPPDLVHHLDGNPANNKWENLALSTKAGFARGYLRNANAAWVSAHRAAGRKPPTRPYQHKPRPVAATT